ncbi:Nitrous oxide reductase maturation protein, outer-membrane lipoprotein NosL [hydrothermal vent metagenome]|uniref:Nitrous oxide reductase maturation protein, outer-membrane lipoprotein NosL n=1 Tax=hydrothermal vent metagenome TaxID=652676 RepID=A0A1W1EBP7_9ZZZZ
MVTSDRRNSVQVINPETGKSYMFDDIGCMFLWFVEDKIEWQDKAKVWINDVDTGKWIDAKEAYYSAGNITPMAYGFAAHAKKDNIIKKNKEVIMYDALPKLIIEMEEKNNNRRAY